jgi:hypothetical protein
MGPSLRWGDEVAAHNLQVAPPAPRAYLDVNQAKGAP